MASDIAQTIMLLLRLLMNFKTCRHCNLEFTFVTLIYAYIDSRRLHALIQCKTAGCLWVSDIWYSKWLHHYLTSVISLPFVSACLYFHSEFAQRTFIHKSRVVCLKVFFERGFLKVSIVTLATVFVLHEFSFIILFYQC